MTRYVEIHVLWKWHVSWKCQDSCREMPCEMPRLVSWKKIFPRQTKDFYSQILCGAMRVHACKSEVINERYCTPMQLCRVSKKPSVKADLALYSPVVDAYGQCMSVSFMLGFNLDFSFFDILIGFCKSSHISVLVLISHIQL